MKLANGLKERLLFILNMTIEDIKEYKRNAIEILRKNSQYATAKATEEAFNTLIWVEKALSIINSVPTFHEAPLPEDVFDSLKP